MGRRGAGRAALCIAFLLAASLPLAAQEPALLFSPEAWRFGMILQGQTVQGTLTVTNRGSRPARVSVSPTCDCNTVDPPQRLIPAGEQGEFLLGYDSSDDTGNVRKDFLVRTDVKGLEKAYYTSQGTVRAERAVPVPPPPERPAGLGAWVLRGVLALVLLGLAALALVG